MELTDGKVLTITEGRDTVNLTFEESREPYEKYSFIDENGIYSSYFTIETWKDRPEEVHVVEHVPYKKDWYKGEERYVHFSLEPHKEAISHFYEEKIREILRKKQKKEDDIQKVVQLTYQAALGDTDAMLELGNCYLNGVGDVLNNNLVRAVKCYHAADRLGNPLGKYYILCCIEGRDKSFIRTAIGIKLQMLQKHERRSRRLREYLDES